MSGIVRAQKKRNPFVQIDKTPLLDKNLSWKARGILAYLLTKPDHWQTSVPNLVKASDKDGRESLQSGLKELEQAGYLLRYRIQNELGIFEGWETVVFETPEDAAEWKNSRQTVFPSVGETDVLEDTKNDLPTNGFPVNRLSRQSVFPHQVINEIEVINKKPVITDVEAATAKTDFSVNDAWESEPVPNGSPKKPDQENGNTTRANVLDEDQDSAALPPEVLREIEKVAYDWRKRPWMIDSGVFHPDMIKAVWASNSTYFSLKNSVLPNHKHITSTLKLLERQLKHLDNSAVAAYRELEAYWNTAQALSNPDVGEAFVMASINAEKQVAVAKAEQDKRDFIRSLENL